MIESAKTSHHNDNNFNSITSNKFDESQNNIGNSYI